MMTFVLVFGAMWLAAKYLSAVLPKGFWYSAFAAIICIVAAPLIGFAAGVIMHASGLGGDVIKPGEHLLAGITTGALAIIVAPFFVAYYRRKPALASAPVRSAFDNLKRP